MSKQVVPAVCVNCHHKGPVNREGVCEYDIRHLVDPEGPCHEQEVCGCKCVVPAEELDEANLKSCPFKLPLRVEETFNQFRVADRGGSIVAAYHKASGVAKQCADLIVVAVNAYSPVDTQAEQEQVPRSV